MNIDQAHSQEKFINTVISCILLRFYDNDKENKTINNDKNGRVCKEDMMSLLSKVKDYKGLFSATALSATLAVAPNALAQDFTKTSHQPTPQTVSLRTHSELVPDENGTLWFRQGADSDTKYSMAQDVSVEDGGKIVIVAASEPSLAMQTAQAGRKFEGWLGKLCTNPTEGTVFGRPLAHSMGKVRFSSTVRPNVAFCRHWFSSPARFSHDGRTIPAGINCRLA